MTKTTPSPRSEDVTPHPVDVHVGGRVRLRRKLLGFSQNQAAQMIGVSFQQVQKYERGDNRISASKLHMFAKAFGVPVAFFFDDYDDPEPDTARPDDPLYTTGSLRFLTALGRLPDEGRERLLAFVEHIGRRD